jgi:subtilisin family serine protease
MKTREVASKQWIRLIVASYISALAVGCDTHAPLQGSNIDDDGDTDRATLQIAENQIELWHHYIVRLDERKGIADPIAIASSVNAVPTFIYRSAILGFAAHLSMTQLQSLENNPMVISVTKDHYLYPSAVQRMDMEGQPWGLDRISQRNLPLNNAYTYWLTGAGVHAYVIDTGIDTSHGDFGGRADNLFDVFGGSGFDNHGHGTHVAGILGGGIWGIAKEAKLHGIKVLNPKGTSSEIIAGIDWVAANHIKPAVANISIGPCDTGVPCRSTDSNLDAAIDKLAALGVFVAVAAGNSFDDACFESPARAPHAFTVAASARDDSRLRVSNYGPCVDAYAPGAAIRSSVPANQVGVMSGTSMAAPHAAGIAAIYKQHYGDVGSDALGLLILNDSNVNKITDNITGTPNKLLRQPF